MTKSWTLFFDAKGKLILPADLLEHLRWDSGEPIRVTAQGDMLTLERKRAIVSRVFGSLALPPRVPTAQAKFEPTPIAKIGATPAPEVIVNGD
jgi:hypothetical protein